MDGRVALILVGKVIAKGLLGRTASGFSTEPLFLLRCNQASPRAALRQGLGVCRWQLVVLVMEEASFEEVCLLLSHPGVLQALNSRCAIFRFVNQHRLQEGSKELRIIHQNFVQAHQLAKQIPGTNYPTVKNSP